MLLHVAAARISILFLNDSMGGDIHPEASSGYQTLAPTVIFLTVYVCVCVSAHALVFLTSHVRWEAWIRRCQRFAE